MIRTLNRPALVAVVGITGFLIAVSFNTTTRLDETRPERATDLAGVVRDLEGQRVELEVRLADLRDQMDIHEKAAADDAGVSDSYSRELDSAREVAGLSGVAGPGLEILLGDGSEVAAGTDPNDYLIHDTDIAAVVNALLAGGAEAVDVNGERVVATTPIRCAGTTVLVNATRLGSPYVIRAVGDTDMMEEALATDAIASLLFGAYKSQFGLQAEVTLLDEVMVEPYRGSLRPQHVSIEEGASS